MPQSKFTELCSPAAVLSQSKFASCEARQPLCHKVNLPRCGARRRHLTMTCDIFGTGQTNTLTLCYLLGKTYKSAHSNATLESLKSTRSGVYISAKFAINSHCSYKKNLAIKSLCIFYKLRI